MPHCDCGVRILKQLGGSQNAQFAGVSGSPGVDDTYGDYGVFKQQVKEVLELCYGTESVYANTGKSN